MSEKSIVGKRKMKKKVSWLIPAIKFHGDFTMTTTQCSWIHALWSTWCFRRKEFICRCVWVNELVTRKTIFPLRDILEGHSPPSQVPFRGSSLTRRRVPRLGAISPHVLHKSFSRKEYRYKCPKSFCLLELRRGKNVCRAYLHAYHSRVLNYTASGHPRIR